MAKMKLVQLVDKFHGRVNQNTDTRHVAYLVSVLDAGQKFETNPEVTSDGIIIDGRHRIDAYRDFYAKAQNSLDEVEIEVAVYPVSYNNASEKILREIELRAFKANCHKKGKASSFEDLKYAVGKCLFDEELSDGEITSRFSPQVAAGLVRKAILAAKESMNQIRLSEARRAIKAGMSEKKALKQAGLPIGTSLDVRKIHDRVRANKIVEEGQKLAQKWHTMYGRNVERFDNGDLTQAQLLEIAKRMQTASSTLTRKADAIHKQALEHINNTAQRLRTAVA